MSAIVTTETPRYGAVEALLILIALALVAFTGWYIRHATVAANNSYSIVETSQKASTPNQAVLDKNKAAASQQ